MVLPMLRRRGVLAAALLLLAAPATASRLLTSKQTAFIKVMEAGVRENNVRMAQRARRTRLYENLLAKARPAPPGLVVNGKPDFMRVPTDATTKKRRRLADDDGDDDWVYNEDDDLYDWGEFGFDATLYSIKYVGCSAVTAYSDEMAEQNDVKTVLETKRFVIFRLCLTDYCSSDASTGCSSNYGEYVMLMDEWLEFFAQYNEEKLQKFCEFCEECMQLDCDDDGCAQRQRRLGDDAVDDQVANAAANSNCEYYIQCYDYLDTCEENEDDDNDDEPIEYQEYFECREFEANNNNRFLANNNNGAYLAPHCGSDGYTISIGLYYDEFCSEYMGDDISVADYTGLKFEDDALAEYYPSDCISCKESDNPYQVVDEDAEDENDVMELCENLYIQAAKCNRYFNDAEDESYLSANQMTNENMVCSFIENLVQGTYDESGEIYIDNESWYENWKNLETYTHIVEEVSPLQIAGLVFTVLGTLILAIYACYLHRAITRKAPWRPRRGGPADAAGKISRQNSGIVMGRSRSGGSYHGGTMT